MLEVLDAAALRLWCRTALELLGRERENIDALNVFPVADGDTGTNLFLTVEAACEAVEAGAQEHPDDFAAALHDLAHGAFLGARGNSGVILSQILRGMSEAVASAPDVKGVGGRLLGVALARASRSAYAAVAAPVEGTILTVARDVADAVTQARSEDLGDVVQEALAAATDSLARTPDQMALLRRHGVVDAGGAGLVVLLRALVEVVTGVVPTATARSWEAASTRRSWRPVAGSLDAAPGADTRSTGWTGRVLGRQEPDPPGEFEYEVMYLLEAPESSVAKLRVSLGELGDSLLVVGGEDLWNVHVHADDVGAVIEAGLEVGRPYRIRVSHLAVRTEGGEVEGCAEAPIRDVLLLVEGAGVATLARAAGATAVAVAAGSTIGTSAVLGALRERAPGEVIVIAGGERFRSVADAAAQDLRRGGARASVVPVRAAVQALAALAVHDSSRRFDDDVVAMTAAARATRYGAVAVAEHKAMTSAGVCEPGDVLGLLDGDVVLIAAEPDGVARELLDRLLGGGGELVTLVHGEDGAALARSLRSYLHADRADVECVVYAAGATSDLLLLGVE